MMKTIHKFEIGQKVVYEGIIGIIETKGSYVDGRPSYGLVAEEDKELSCTADESKCELYVDQEIDQEPALNEAKFNPSVIMHSVGNLTDKHFRDGNH